MEIYPLLNSGFSKSRLYTFCIIIVLHSLVFYSCKNSSEVKVSEQTNFSVKTECRFLNTDSVGKPVIIPAGKPEIVNVKKSKELLVNSIIKKALSPGDDFIIKPKVIIPGTNGLKLPAKIEVTENPLLCKAPDVVVAKDAYVKDINPYNFSSFSKLQGLRHDQIRSMIQVNLGNLWLGTDDGFT